MDLIVNSNGILDYGGKAYGERGEGAASKRLKPARQTNS
jgi:hypothetical protein